jgi:transposase-like protein
MLLAHPGEYGMVTQLSRDIQVSRQTLYTWRDQAGQALVAAFTPAPPPSAPVATTTARQILTVWMTHASDRGIQAVFAELRQQGVSLATITAVLHEAQQRAITWMQTHVPSSTRALALDEIYGHRRDGAYLNVVDVHSGAVWASEGLLAVDTESWMLVLWSLQDRGLHWDRAVMDAGAPMHAACQQVTPEVTLHLDQWHLWQECAQVQGRLDRVVAQQTPVVARQTARVASGQRPKGRAAKADLATQAATLAATQRVADGLRYLSAELHRLLAVVVVGADQVWSPAQRQEELDALLALWDELAATCPSTSRAEVQRLGRRIRADLPALLAFVPHVAQVQQDLARVLAPAQQALLGWAWLRREALDWTGADILAAIPPDWRDAARVLLATWDDAVRVSSAVERWHSILRPHLAVRRRLTTGMLALLAVWHNHRVYPRGIHKGQSPLHLSGMTDAPTDWLVALGYSPTAADTALPASLALAA